MRQIVILILVLGLGIILQLTIISRITIFHGFGDLLLVIICAWASQENSRFAWAWGFVGGLLIGFISAAPWFINISVYLLLVGISRILIRKIWQAPLLANFLVVFLGSILMTSLTFLFRLFFENLSLSFGDVFITIILPTTLINMFLMLITRPVIGQISKWAFVEEISG